MLKIGITGGIGSGKSTVCKVWESLGAYIINADDLAKDVMKNNEIVKEEIIQAFGSESYYKDGRLNRGHLAREAFEKGRVKELNAIVHPHIPDEVDRRMAAIAEQNFEVVVYEAALLLENLRPGELDYVVLVLADEDKRLRWVKERDQVEEKAVRERVSKQQDFGKLTHLADVVLENDGTLEELKAEARSLYYNFLNVKAD